MRRAVLQQQLIVRLCRLQAEVMRAGLVTGAADCFCGEDGFWTVAAYRHNPDEHYRNDGEAVAFIERVVRQALTDWQATTAAAQELP